MPTIYDNLQSKLLDELQKRLDEATRADFSVGYFNLRGWRGLAEQIDRLPDSSDVACRLLVGMNEGPSDTVRRQYRLTESHELMDNRTARRLREGMAEEFQRQLMVGAPSNADEATLRRLKHQLKAKKVRVKLFLAHPLHAKLYLVHRDDDVTPIVGFVGSSNLTFAGLSKQGELNVDVVEKDATQKLQRWFEERWNDQWCVDITNELAEIIEDSWAREEILSPYLIYLKIAYHLSEDARAGLTEFKLPKELEEKLFDFQKAAVKIAAHHMNRRDGVMLGDVVGLGKTLMATAVARIFQEDHGTETLIICPKNLETMWQQYVEEYRLLARVLPSSEVLTRLPDLRRYRVVLIDESHNLRNREGKRYRAIAEYIRANDSKCILLSATPYNKEYLDLSAQLALFIDDDEEIAVRPDALIREMTETRFVATHQCKLKSLKAFEKSFYADDWRTLMSRYLVRRTRSFIQQNYAEIAEDGRSFLAMPDGGRYYFPKRVPRTVKFALDESDPNDQYARMFAPETEAAIDRLRLPRYGLGNYASEDAERLASAAEREQLAGLARAGQRLIGFSRTNLFKRMESSGEVFLQSVDSHILRNHVYLYAIEQGLPLPIGTLDRARLDTRHFDEDVDALPGDANDDDDDDTGVARKGGTKNEQEYEWEAQRTYEEYRQSYQKRFKWLRSELFDDSLREDLLHDAGVLVRIQERAGSWDPQRDAKLNALEDLISKHHPDEKVLVFSQFADTVNYLTEQLKERALTAIEGVSGNSADPTALAWRFSPVSNERQQFARKEGELRVLIATDVLSEGQNLQDAAIVVNFDLPWAIVRLIQRAGRVDRLGQEHPEILCYSFLPAEGIERIIKLRDRVKRRLRENHEVVGADEIFFEGDEETRPFVDLYNENAGVLDGEDDTEVDMASYAYQIWKNAQDNHPELTRRVERLPNVVFATRHHVGSPDDPEGVLVYARTPDGNDSLARTDSAGNTVTESPLEILNMAACSFGTLGMVRDERHHDLVKRGVEHLIRNEWMTGGQLGKPRGARYRTYERLAAYLKAEKAGVERMGMHSMLGPDLGKLDKAIESIYRAPLRSGATESLNRLLRTGAQDEQLAQHVIALWEEDKLVVGEDEEPDMEPTILCSMGLFGG